MREQRGREKAVFPKLQEESSEQRAFPLGCIMMVHASPLTFLPLKASIQALVRHNCPLLCELRILKPRLLWCAWLVLGFFWFVLKTVLLEASGVDTIVRGKNPGQAYCTSDNPEHWQQITRKKKTTKTNNTTKTQKNQKYKTQSITMMFEYNFYGNGTKPRYFAINLSHSYCFVSKAFCGFICLLPKKNYKCENEMADQIQLIQMRNRLSLLCFSLSTTIILSKSYQTKPQPMK